MFLSMVPIESQEIENTEKFLNQVSEYSYTMANKCIDGQDLSDEDMDKIQELYNYANDLSFPINSSAIVFASSSEISLPVTPFFSSLVICSENAPS